MNLPLRLLQVTQFLDYKNINQKILIDLGCDHGLLSIYLYKYYFFKKIYGLDQSKTAIANALKNKKKYLPELKNDNLHFLVADGLKWLQNNTNILIDYIIVAGLGTHFALNLLKLKLDNVKCYVFCLNTDISKIRSSLKKYHLFLKEEAIVKIKNHYYFFIKITKAKTNFLMENPYQEFIGSYYLQNFDFIYLNYLQRLEEKFLKLMYIIPKKSKKYLLILRKLNFIYKYQKSIYNKLNLNL